MTYSLSFLPEVANDAITGYDWYEDRSTGLGNDFLRLFYANAIKTANSLIFVTPEYNRLIPGALKNALDHGSRPYGENAWAQKPAGIIGASPGPSGTAMAQQHLRNVLSPLNVLMLCQPEAYIQVKDGSRNLERPLRGILSH